MNPRIQGRLLRWAVLLSFFALAAGVGGWLVTRPLVDAADRFVALVGQGKSGEAFDLLARGHGYGNRQGLEQAMRSAGLDQAASVSWGPRNFIREEGSVKGTVTTRGGAGFPIVVRLVRAEGEWRVFAVEAEGSAPPASPTVASPKARPASPSPRGAAASPRTAPPSPR